MSINLFTREGDSWLLNDKSVSWMFNYIFPPRASSFPLPWMSFEFEKKIAVQWENVFPLSKPQFDFSWCSSMKSVGKQSFPSDIFFCSDFYQFEKISNWTNSLFNQSWDDFDVLSSGGVKFSWRDWKKENYSNLNRVKPLKTHSLDSFHLKLICCPLRIICENQLETRIEQLSHFSHTWPTTEDIWWFMKTHKLCKICSKFIWSIFELISKHATNVGHLDIKFQIFHQIFCVKIN